MDLSGCPPTFNSAQRKAWKVYMCRHWNEAFRLGIVHQLDDGAQIYARYGFEFPPRELHENQKGVMATLKMLGVIHEFST